MLALKEKVSSGSYVGAAAAIRGQFVSEMIEKLKGDIAGSGECRVIDI